MFEHGSAGERRTGTVIGRWGDEWVLLEVSGVGVVSAPVPAWGERLAVGTSVVVELGPEGEVLGVSLADGAPA
jgi:hypothetical protein